MASELTECPYCKATRWEHSDVQWAYCRSRILEAALRDVERIERELPQLIQPERTCFYMIALRDRIKALEKQLRESLERSAGVSGPTGGEK